MWRSNDNLRSWHSHSTLLEVSFSCFTLCRSIQACWSLCFQKILLFPPVGVLNHPPSPTFVLTLKDHLILSLLHFINFRAWGAGMHLHWWRPKATFQTWISPPLMSGMVTSAFTQWTSHWPKMIWFFQTLSLLTALLHHRTYLVLSVDVVHGLHSIV